MSDCQEMKWFNEARFGLFLHWGCYAQLGKGEWNMFFERTPVNEYAKIAATFNPENFDPEQWACEAAGAGMKYMVLTTRHHDGFCLFDSKVSDFTSVKCSPQKKDYVAAYVKACRKYGLKVGLYYSLMDWRFPGYFNYKTDIANAEALRRQCHEQVRELMTNYGKIDILWYDGLWLAHEASTDHEVAPAFWRGKELNAMARKLQPGIIINNRAGDPADFSTPEGAIKPPDDPERNWECCKTMTAGWGHYSAEPDPFQLSAPFVIRDLIDCVSDSGNYLVNVGVTPDGRLPETAVKVMRKIGKWLKVNGESIYGAGKIDFQNDHYAWTRKGNVYYYHLYTFPLDGKKVFPMMDAKVRKVSILGSNRKIKVEYASNNRLIFANLPSKAPVAPFATLKIEFEKAPKKIEVQEGHFADWLFPEK